MRRRMALGLLSAGCLLLVAALGWAGARGAGTECVLGSYGTSLRGRTRAQVFNALRAAQSLDGAVLQPGETFSFNKRVGPWNAAAGYRKAPVSFDGEMVPSYGGGVCQTSTTLYNAAMLAGLEIVERHRHVRPPAYVAPGRDAAVAMPGVDLRIRNPYPYPVRIQARNIGESLIVTVHGRGPRRPTVLRTEVESVARPLRVREAGMWKRGTPGFTALTYRQAGARAEVSSHLSYPPVNGLEP
ncbi:MAG TPA: VanW family protein [Armatimonadota bacterium]|jgi:vancomycin resistance protein VanW|nr:VanW family protein [Armatimonadota bacterium]HOM80493.1 VanW family protein [Armatimonadota bacterium]HPO71462.1 VanW family protein [Armatimonadota bacterium]HPT96876.1 VanW family protein [Armatimonadota bacterium]